MGKDDQGVTKFIFPSEPPISRFTTSLVCVPAKSSHSTALVREIFKLPTRKLWQSVGGMPTAVWSQASRRLAGTRDCGKRNRSKFDLIADLVS